MAIKKNNRERLAHTPEATSYRNEWAIKILIKHTSDLDGGELEDAYIALGESVDIKPIILLREFKEQRMTENQFAQAVEMLSLSFTDNESGKVLALKARKKKILLIKDVNLKQQKRVAIKAIDSRIGRILEE